MNHHIRTAAILQRGALMPARARIGQVARRRYATEPASPSPPPREPSKSGTFYKSFGTPILKCFLGALFTYQVAYWAWLKLESIESKHDKDTEIHDLKQELNAAVLARKQEASEKVGGVKDAGGMEGKVEQEQEKKKGWFGW